MATVFGHALAATAAAGAVGERERRRWLLVLAAVMGVAPDLDLVAAILLKSHRITLAHIPLAHRGFTHSLFFVLSLALLFWLIGFRARSPRILLGLALAGLTHPILDMLMARGQPVRWFWPFSSRGYLSPVKLIPTVYFSRSFSGLIGQLTDPGTRQGLLLELVIFLPLLLAGRPQKGKAVLFRSTCVGLSLAGFFLTYLLYQHQK